MTRVFLWEIAGRGVLSTNQHPNPRWRKPERQTWPVVFAPHRWRSVSAGQTARLWTWTASVSTATSPACAHQIGRSSTWPSRLSPAPVERALPDAPVPGVGFRGLSGAGVVGRQPGTALPARACRCPSLPSFPADRPRARPVPTQTRRPREHHRPRCTRSRRAALRRLGRRSRRLRAGRVAVAPGRAGCRRRTTPPSRASWGRCCSPRTPSPTSPRRCGASTSTVPPTRSSTTRSSTSTVAASPPTRSPSPPSCSGAASCSGSAGRRTSTRSRPTCRSPPTPATTPRSCARRRSCAGWSTPAPRSCRSATPARARSTTWSTRRRPRSTRSPTAAPAEDYAPLSDIMDGVLDEIEAIGNREAGLYGVPTGFADLDDLTNGLHAGQMVIVAARPAMGKSTLALDLCRAASIHNNLTSCFFSLEMTRSEITMRLLSAEAKVPLNHIRNGQMNDDDWAKLARKMAEVSVGADVHRRLAQHDDDGDPGQGPPAQAAPRPAADHHRLHAADDVGQEGRVPPARGLGVLPPDQAAGQGARGADHRALPAQPWSRAARRQAPDDERPARVRARSSRTPTW